ncbi:UNVERIFIED_CONTAM: hypothetical protein Slati_3844900, partial [Sesamum latifolium]
GAVTRSSSSAVNMVGQDLESPRRAASPSGQAAIPEDETSRLAEMVMNLEEKVSSLEVEITGLNSELEDCRQVIQQLASAFGGGGIADMRCDMEQMLIQIGLLQCAVSNAPVVAHDAGVRLRIPELKAYGGAHDAKEVENFLFDMEQYFLAANVENEVRKVSTTTMYLTGDAKLWWRTKYSKIQANQVRLDTWALLREAIAVLPGEQTRKDRQTTSNPAQNKTGRANSFRSNSNRVGGDKKPHAQTGSQGSSNRNKPQENRQGAPQRSTGCFLCDGPHRYRDCRKKQLLNALATFTDKALSAKLVEPQAFASGGNDSLGGRGQPGCHLAMVQHVVPSGGGKEDRYHPVWARLPRL